MPEYEELETYGKIPLTKSGWRIVARKVRMTIESRDIEKEYYEVRKIGKNKDGDDVYKQGIVLVDEEMIDDVIGILEDMKREVSGGK